MKVMAENKFEASINLQFVKQLNYSLVVTNSECVYKI